MNKKWLSHIAPFFGGVVFAIGLGLSGMLEPKKVVGFLDLFGDWDPTLAFVMGGAVIIHMAFYHLIVKRSSPLLAQKFHIPTRKDLDKKLIIGGVLFGMGWGITGICPGPGIVAVTTGHTYTVVFMVALIAGTIAAKFIKERF